jgi:L-lactate dehydrogenase (cytochrome)
MTQKWRQSLGADAILLSNHGGRQLDRAPVMLHLLSDIKSEFKKDYEIHIDTGIMHGADVLAAVALGAQFTYVGRAYLYGLMAGGQDGVEKRARNYAHTDGSQYEVVGREFTR